MVLKDKGRKKGKSRRPWVDKKSIKHFDHRGDRNATKQAIREERYDDIPQGQKVKPEDPWSWD